MGNLYEVNRNTGSVTTAGNITASQGTLVVNDIDPTSSGTATIGSATLPYGVSYLSPVLPNYESVSGTNTRGLTSIDDNHRVLTHDGINWRLDGFLSRVVKEAANGGTRVLTAKDSGTMRIVDCTNFSQIYSLPSSSSLGSNGAFFGFCKQDPTSNSIELTFSNAADSVGGFTKRYLKLDGDHIVLGCNGSEYFIISNGNSLPDQLFRPHRTPVFSSGQFPYNVNVSTDRGAIIRCVADTGTGVVNLPSLASFESIKTSESPPYVNTYTLYIQRTDSSNFPVIIAPAAGTSINNMPDATPISLHRAWQGVLLDWDSQQWSIIEHTLGGTFDELYGVSGTIGALGVGGNLVVSGTIYALDGAFTNSLTAPTPSTDSQVATKGYVDSVSGGGGSSKAIVGQGFNTVTSGTSTITISGGLGGLAVEGAVPYRKGSSTGSESNFTYDEVTNALVVDNAVMAGGLTVSSINAGTVSGTVGAFSSTVGVQTLTATTISGVKIQVDGGNLEVLSGVIDLSNAATLTSNIQHIGRAGLGSLYLNTSSGTQVQFRVAGVTYANVGLTTPATPTVGGIFSVATVTGTQAQFGTSISAQSGSFSNSLTVSGVPVLLSSSFPSISGGLSYQHTQSVSSATWTVTHNLLTTQPIVEVWDNNNKVVIPQEIEATSNNQVVITFSTAKTGRATITNVGSQLSVTYTGSLVTDHGDLTGLSDDDHSAIYPGINQTESITGAWNYTNSLTVSGSPVHIGQDNVGLQFTLHEPSNFTYKLMQYSPSTWVVDKAVYQTTSGTLTANIRKEGGSITNLSALSVTTTEGETSATGNNTVTVGDTLDVVVSSVSSTANMLSITLVGRKLGN